MESIYNDVIKGRFIRPFLFGSRKNILSVEANIDEKEGCIYLHFDVELQNDYRPGYPIPKRSIGKEDRLYKKARIPHSLGCGMNCRIRNVSGGGEIISPLAFSLHIKIPAVD